MSLPNMYKQRDNRFFPGWAYGLPKSILDMPLALWETTLWVCITYFAVGFSYNAGRWASTPCQ